MTQRITLPPVTRQHADGAKDGGWWHSTEQAGRIVCDLCPRACSLKPGDRGFCFVRENRDGQMVLTTYGRSTGFCVDPIEKKPLNHFFPGTRVLSFGTAGCNLGCKFCQNWSISKSRQVTQLSEHATPETIIRAAQQLGCRSVAFTYNDPVIWAEYAIDVAKACRGSGVKTVAVTAGYITAEARETFFDVIDAANVDLKAFTEDFYRKLTLSHLQPVLDTLRWLRSDSDVWLELTNLLIPQANDAPDELQRMCDWILDNLGDAVPVHFTAYHPDFRLRDRSPTPPATLLDAYATARRSGLKYVYVGNVNDRAHQSTYCPHCAAMVIERDWYELGRYALQEDRCQHCGGRIDGRFDAQPGNWGRQRLPVRIAQFAHAQPVAAQEEEKTTMNLRAATTPVLNGQQERAIHTAACEMVAAAASRQPVRLTDRTLAGAAPQQVMGAFVSLKRRGQLRGCCGFLGQTTPLAEALYHAATRTATEDLRLPAVSPSELANLGLEVCLLHRPQPVDAQGEARAAAVVIGQHGLYIRQGKASGLLLPGVAVEHQLDAVGFLEQVCLKANLHPSVWKDDTTHLTTFEGHTIGGPFAPQVARRVAAVSGGLVSETDVAQLAEHCQRNIVALVQGATASCYTLAAVDGTVQAVALRVQTPGNAPPLQLNRLSLRPGLPLQSTLYGLAQVAAQRLTAAGMAAQMLDGLQIALTVLWDAAMHGSVAQSDVDAISTARRAVLVVEGTRSAWVYQPQQAPNDLLAVASAAAQIRNSATALVLSLAAVSTAAAVRVANVPQPQRGPETRLPAVAGSFYPAEASSLASAVDRLLPAASLRRQRCAAVMVPHAGLQYSGKIAAQVYQQIDIPEVVIIIGPRHTRFGMDWAVAPHTTWALPGCSVASDPDLAHLLAATIPDLHLDARAHQQEHSIEVQLPLLARLAPHTRVVGITLGAGDEERCRTFAAGLAEVLSKRSDHPLLVISSDLNHYASDVENRRLDAIALAALERLDALAAYQTIRQHKISMCGLLPATVVLETLCQLGTLRTCQRVAYATSADAGGDAHRVVGYAGMVFG